MPPATRVSDNKGGQRIITAYATLDFANTAAATKSAGVAVTAVPGARKGDVAHIRPLALAGSQLFSAIVTADDEVTCHFDNITAGAVDPASQDFVIHVVKST